MSNPPRTSWTTFGPDPPPDSLPIAAQKCLAPMTSSPSCDNYIGYAASGQGFCAQDEYKRTTYCACVNNAVACPQYSMASCANAAFAYKPSWWYTKTGPNGDGPSKNETCEKTPICVNLVEVGGNQNMVANVTQQCGTVTNVTNMLKANPMMSAFALILFIMLIIVLAVHTEDDDDTTTSSGPDNTPSPPL